MPAPVLDGTSTGVASGTTTVSAALTTTTANDIICALVYFENPGATTDRWVTGVAGGGLTWHKRTQATQFAGISQPLGSYGSQSLELWWALAPTALSGVTITATTNASFDDAAILVFGVSGCNTTNPWDAHPSLGQKYFNAATAASFSAISTAQANDFLIFGFGTPGNMGAIGTLPTGFSQIGFVQNGGGSQFASVGAAYRAVTSTQANQTYTWGSSFPTLNLSLFDVLTADTGGTTALPRPTFETLAFKGVSATNTATINSVGLTANDVIVLLSYCEAPSGSAGPAITSVSGGGLTWVQRSRSHGSSRGSLEVWYAQITGTLADTTITVNYAATFENLSLQALSIAGCSSGIWDTNSSLPATVSNTAGGAWTPSLTVSTSQANNMMLAVTGINNGAVFSSTPPAYSLIHTTAQSGGGLVSIFATTLQGRSATQTSAAVAWGAAVGSADSGGEYVVDALTSSAAVIPISLSATLSATSRGAGALSIGASVTESIWDAGSSVWDGGASRWDYTGAHATMLAGSLAATSQARSAALNVRINLAGQITATSRAAANLPRAITLAARLTSFSAGRALYAPPPNRVLTGRVTATSRAAAHATITSVGGRPRQTEVSIIT